MFRPISICRNGADKEIGGIPFHVPRAMWNKKPHKPTWHLRPRAISQAGKLGHSNLLVTSTIWRGAWVGADCNPRSSHDWIHSITRLPRLTWVTYRVCGEIKASHGAGGGAAVNSIACERQIELNNRTPSFMLPRNQSVKLCGCPRDSNIWPHFIRILTPWACTRHVLCLKC